MAKLVSSWRPPRGLCELKSAYNANNSPLFNAQLKKIPGCRWEPLRKSWLVPTELVNLITSLGQKYHVSPRILPLMPTPKLFEVNADGFDMYEWQEAALPVVNKEWRQILCFEMGLGKTLPALVASKNATTSLFVTKAGVRSTIFDEVGKWLGKDYVTNTSVITKLADWETAKDRVITSYELLDSQFCFDRKWDNINFDEIHYVKNAESKRSKLAAEIAHKNPQALQLGLTGTMIANQPVDAWHQLEVLWPGRFGTRYKFSKRYAQATRNEYVPTWTDKDGNVEGGESFSGLNPLYEAELRHRLQHCVQEATKAEYGHLLPPFTVQAIRNRPNDLKVKAAMAKVSAAKNRAKQEDALNEVCATAYKEKAAVVLDRLESATSNNVTHILVATHLKSSSKNLLAAIRKQFGADYAVFYVDGDVPLGKKRDLIFNEAIKAAKAILVCTQHVVSTGLNKLVKFTRVLLAELYWSPAVLLQFLGRFSRLNSTEPSFVELLIFDGTYEEQVVYSVEEKITTANKVSKAGQGQQAVIKALEDVDDDDAFCARLAGAAFSLADDEGY